MPYDGNGLFIPLPPPNYPAVAGTTIRAAQFNDNLSDIFGGLNNALTRDGQGGPTADINWRGFDITNVGALDVGGFDIIDSIQNSAFKLLGSVAGVDTITAVAAPALTTYVAGQVFSFLPAGYNTAAVTLNLNGLGAKPVVFSDGTPLDHTNLSASTYATVFYDGVSFRLLSGFKLSSKLDGPNGQIISFGQMISGVLGNFVVSLPEKYLTGPTAVAVSAFADFRVNQPTSGLSAAPTLVVIGATGRDSVALAVTCGGGGFTPNAPAYLFANSASWSLDFTGTTW